MAYNKTEHLRRNIDAIRTAFVLEKEGRTATEAEQEILRSYSGFGAIKEVLEELPLKRNTHLSPLIEELHAVLKENSANDAAYKRYFDSLKASVLTAFYTPPQVTEAIVRILHDQGIEPQRLLEPSAGVGAFVDEIHRQNPHVEATCFEKDALTGLILKHLYPGDHVLVQGFETMDRAYDGYFDLAISNIPFGDVAVFDPAFSTSRNPVRRQGAHALHNYFFMKSVEAVREGGVIAFITSQGVADSERNRPVREWLMQRCDIISAVRLPNNLFFEYAGTEVGSDLLVLQKKTAQQALSVRQKHFIETRKLSNGISVNNIFRSLDRVVQTSALVATNPYGQPAMVFTHAGSVQGIAYDLERMLADDCREHLDLSLYRKHQQAEEPVIQHQPDSQAQVQHEMPTESLSEPKVEPVQTQETSLFPETAGLSVRPEETLRQRRTGRSNGPRRAGEVLSEVLAEVRQRMEAYQAQQMPEPAPFNEEPGPFWQATDEDWEDLNRWIDERESVTKAAAEGYHLDPETGEMIPVEETVAEVVDEHPLSAALPAEELPPIDLQQQDWQPSEQDWAEFGAWSHEQQQQIEEQQPQQPGELLSQEPAAIENAATPEPEAPNITEPGITASPAGNKSTQTGFTGSLFDNIADEDQRLGSSEEGAKTPETAVEPLLTLYDLMGFTAEERSQVNRPRRRRPKPKVAKPAAEEERFVEWREELMISRHERLEAEKRQQETNASPATPPNGAGQATAQTTPEPSQTRPTPESRTGSKPSEPRKTASEPARSKVTNAPHRFLAPVLEHYREGTLVADEEGRIGNIRGLKGPRTMFHPLELPEEQRMQASMYIELRDTYHHLYNNEADRHEANPALREMLGRLYDNFTERYGELNAPRNVDLIKMDPGGDEILGLERYVDGKLLKADIFDHPVSFKTEKMEKTDDVHVALVASLNRFADVNLEYIAQLTGASEDNVLEQLRGRIFFDPDTNGYKIAERVISGNVIEKADRVQRYLDAHPDHKAAQETLVALREATPKPIAFDDLDFNFGERWIPVGIFESYASWLFETDVKISYLPDLDEYNLSARDPYNIKIQHEFAVNGELRRYTGLHLLKHALHNTIPDITKKVEKLVDGRTVEVKVRDGEKIQLANSKIDEIRSGFTDWLRDQSMEFKDRLADTYNRKFNCFVRPHYDGSHMDFPGLDRKALGIEDLYPSQKDAIWMDILLGGGIIDHEVGGGKTLIMCCGAFEKKRLGLAHKPMIIGLKANIHEIARTFCTAYPMARVLYPGKEDFTPKKREQIFRQIKNNDWDAIILTHEQFGMIPQSPEIQQEILQAELDSVEQNLMVLRQQGKNVSRRMMTGCLKRQANLQAKLQKVQHALENRRDDSVDFRRMGIDHLYVDESHKFKNLTFTTRHDRVAGLGNPTAVSGRSTCFTH